VNVAFSRRAYLIATAILVLLRGGIAQHSRQAERSPQTDSQIEQWLNGPDRRDFDWKVQIAGPTLTFQQRYVVEARVLLPVRKLARAGISFSDIHFAVKVKDSEGHWLPGEYHTLFQPPVDMARAREIVLYSHFFLRPGKYAVVVVAGDSRHGRGNVWRSQLHVAPLSQDPLPEIGRNLPDVEFPASGSGDPPATGPAKLYLPVRPRRPIQLDVVVNLSLSDAMNTRYAQAPDWVYRTNAGVLLQVGRVLSQFDLTDGCVRVSALDILRQKVFSDRIPASETNWGEMINSVQLLERSKIDARMLQQLKTTPSLFARFLEQAASDSRSCGKPARKPLHVLIVVSDAFLFPGKTQMATIRPESAPGTVCYYLQIDPIRGGTWDQIGRVLGPLHPRRWEFSDGTRFRKALAELITDIETLPAEATPNASPGSWF